MMRAVIFDVDGTLAETERDGHRLAFNQAFAAHGLPYRWSVEEYGELLSTTGGRRRLARYLASKGHPGDLDSLAGQIHKTKTELFAAWVERGEDVRPRPGVGELLEGLRRSGTAAAVASTGRSDWVVPLLKRLFPGDPFEVVVTGDDVERLKPDPEAYLVALARLGVTAAEALAVEDSPPGLAAAEAAGIACLVVASEYNRGGSFPGAAAIVRGYLASEADGAADPAAAECLQGGVTAEALSCLHALAARA